MTSSKGGMRGKNYFSIVRIKDGEKFIITIIICYSILIFIII